MKKNVEKKNRYEDLPYGQLILGIVLTVLVAISAILSILTQKAQGGAFDSLSALKILLFLVCLGNVIRSILAIYHKRKSNAE